MPPRDSNRMFAMQPRKGSTQAPAERGSSPTIIFIATSLAVAAWFTAIAAALTLPRDLIEGPLAAVPGAPQKAATAAPVPGQLVVKGARTNLRVGPTVQSAVIRRLEPGRKLKHLFGGGPWVMVALPGDGETVGWVHGSLLEGKGLGPIKAGPLEAPRRQAAKRQPLIAEVGFSTFWNEVDKLSKALDCPVPEVTLGEQRSGAFYSCSFGENGNVTLTIEGEVSSTQVKNVRLVWSRPLGDPREGPPAFSPEARRLAEGLARLYGGPLEQRLVAGYLTADEGALAAGVFRIAHQRTVEQSTEKRSLVISLN